MDSLGYCLILILALCSGASGMPKKQPCFHHHDYGHIVSDEFKPVEGFCEYNFEDVFGRKLDLILCYNLTTDIDSGYLKRGCVPVKLQSYSHVYDKVKDWTENNTYGYCFTEGKLHHCLCYHPDGLCNHSAISKVAVYSLFMGIVACLILH